MSGSYTLCSRSSHYADAKLLMQQDELNACLVCMDETVYLGYGGVWLGETVYLGYDGVWLDETVYLGYLFVCRSNGYAPQI